MREVPTGEPFLVNFKFQHEQWGSDVPIETELNCRISDSPAYEAQRLDNVIIVGLNGSGKTTFLTIISDFFSAQASNKLPKGQILKDLIDSWKSKGIQKFTAKVNFQYENYPEYLLEFGPHRVDVLKSILSKKEAYEDIVAFNEDEFSGEVVEFDGDEFDEELNRMMDNPNKYRNDLGGILSITDMGSDSAFIYLELVCEFDFTNGNYSSKLIVDFEDNYDYYDEEISYKTSFEIPFSNPFGPVNFHDTMMNILSRISEEIGREIKWNDYNGLCKFPKIKPQYISSEQTSMRPHNLDSELFECVAAEGLEEEFMQNKSIDEIFSLLEVDLLRGSHGENFRTFIEREYADNGSDEYFEKNQFPYHPSVYEKNVLDHNGEMIPSPAANSNPPEYVRANKIYSCKILPQFNAGFYAHRWQNVVIYLPQLGLIYSQDRDALYQYLKTDMWRNITRKNRIHLLAKLFNVNEVSLTALFAVNDLSPTNGSYLTSGQKRVFTLIEAACNNEFDMLLIDEPEVSLHIDWQRRIVDLVSEYSNAKFKIISTHSPDVIYHHLNRVIEFDSSVED